MITHRSGGRDDTVFVIEAATKCCILVEAATKRITVTVVATIRHTSIEFKTTLQSLPMEAVIKKNIAMAIKRRQEKRGKHTHGRANLVAFDKQQKYLRCSGQ